MLDIPKVEEFVCWLALRSVHVTSLIVTNDLAMTGTLSAYLSTNGIHVVRVCFPPKQTPALREVCAHCPNVMEIELPACVTAEDLNDCIKAWPDLQEISVHEASPGLLDSIAEGFQHLTALTVRNHEYGFTDAFVPATFYERVNAGLRHFNSKAPVTNEGLLALSEHCPRLRSLMTTDLQMTDAVLQRIINRCPHLEAVNLFEFPHVSEQMEITLAQAGRLRKLIACNIPVEMLRLSPALDTLCMLSTRDPSPTLRAVGSLCRDLQELTIHSDQTGETLTPGNVARVDESAVTALAAGCPRLRRLYLNTHASDASLLALAAHCHGLAILTLSSMIKDAITDTGICALAQGCPKLRNLRFPLRPPVTMVGVTALATHCRRLRTVQVSPAVAEEWGGGERTMDKLRVTICQY
jgi:hypothetical protein